MNDNNNNNNNNNNYASLRSSSASARGPSDEMLLIRVATASDVERIHELFAAAMFNDPRFVYVEPDVKKRQEYFSVIGKSKGFQGMLTNFLIYVLLKEGEIIGVSCWSHPNQQKNLPPIEVFFHLLRTLAFARASCWKWFGKMAKLERGIQKNLLRESPKNFWQLIIVCIDPKYQKQGYGQFLLNRLFSNSGIENQPLYQISFEHTYDDLWKKLGFSVIKESQKPIPMYLWRREAQLSTSGELAVSTLSEKSPPSNQSSGPNLDTLNIPQIKDIEIKKKIGSGNFGSVFYGLWSSVPVALKSLANQSSQSEFWQEAHLLFSLRHPNIVMSYGIWKSSDQENFIVMEYCQFDSLWNSLVNYDPILTKSFKLKIAQQICIGMQYLSSKNIIHRDLAARNILLGESHCAKISDVGLARTLHEEDYYRSSHMKIPIRWSAPESFRGKFSTKSDVFSFGIVLWEIFQNGLLPWMGHSNMEVVSFVCEGQVLPQPNELSQAPEMYEVMKSCWNRSADLRPSFSELYEKLSTFTIPDNELDLIIFNKSNESFAKQTHTYQSNSENDNSDQNYEEDEFLVK